PRRRGAAVSPGPGECPTLNRIDPTHPNGQPFMLERNPAPGAAPTATPPDERRAYVRLASDLTATCRPAGRFQTVAWPGKVRDVSPGGVGLVLRHRFRPGTALAVELRETTGTPLRTVLVRVVHATAVVVEGNPCWLLGCAFDEPLGDDEFRALR